MMNIGKLNQRIEIQGYSGTVDSSGYEVVSWTKVIECWAQVSNMSGKEYYRAGQENSSISTKFLIRYNKLIMNYDAEKLQILFLGKKYNVRYVNNVDMKNEYLEIIAEVINNGS